jgi:hypothetical protein
MHTYQSVNIYVFLFVTCVAHQTSLTGYLHNASYLIAHLIRPSLYTQTLYTPWFIISCVYLTFISSLWVAKGCYYRHWYIDLYLISNLYEVIKLPVTIQNTEFPQTNNIVYVLKVWYMITYSNSLFIQKRSSQLALFRIILFFFFRLNCTNSIPTPEMSLTFMSEFVEVG